MPSARLPNHLRGHHLKASELNVANREVERLGRIRVTEPLELVDNSSGILIRLATRLLDSRFAKSGSGGIPALSGSNPGSATVTLYNFDGTSLTAGDTATAYNPSTTAVNPNKWLVLLKVAGYWTVVVEDCP